MVVFNSEVVNGFVSENALNGDQAGGAAGFIGEDEIAHAEGAGLSPTDLTPPPPLRPTERGAGGEELEVPSIPLPRSPSPSDGEGVGG